MSATPKQVQNAQEHIDNKGKSSQSSTYKYQHQNGKWYTTNMRKIIMNGGMWVDGNGQASPAKSGKPPTPPRSRPGSRPGSKPPSRASSPGAPAGNVVVAAVPAAPPAPPMAGGPIVAVPFDVNDISNAARDPRRLAVRANARDNLRASRAEAARAAARAAALLKSRTAYIDHDRRIVREQHELQNRQAANTNPLATGGINLGMGRKQAKRRQVGCMLGGSRQEMAIGPMKPAIWNGPSTMDGSRIHLPFSSKF